MKQIPILRRLFDRSGNFAVIFALAAVPIILLAGGAVDFGRAYYVRSDLQNALDAAALAVASSAETSEGALKSRLETMFTANYHLAHVAAATTPTQTISNNTIDATVSTSVPTTLLSFIMPSIMITVKSQVIKKTSGIELVLALDTTGSMAQNNKMTELKTAAHDLIKNIFGTSDTATAAYVGIVPFTDTVNVGSFNTSYVTDPSTYDWGKDSNGHALGWGGCVMAPNSTHDRDDSFSSSNGKWLPYYWPSSSSNYWKKIKNGKTTYSITSTTGPNVGCVNQPITPLTNQRAPLDTAIDALTPNGSTHINIGLVWAWYTISPEFPFITGKAYDDPKFKKYVVLMTDGDNTYQTFSAYGDLADGKLGTTNQSAAVAELNRRLTTVCNNMKAKGITIFTIALEVSSDTSRQLLEDCATPPGRYFNAQSTDLQSVFSTIGGQISKVRLAK